MRLPRRFVIHRAATGDDARRIEAARRIWSESEPIDGTLAERYLRQTRGLTLDEDLSHVIRFHPRCPWRDHEIIRAPCMIAAMRAIDGNEVTAVQRTRLDIGGAKIGRRMLGRASAAAIKIDSDENVTFGLSVGEGLETCLAGRQMGFRPSWALGSAGAIPRFPVLAGIDGLTLHAETDDAGTNAAAIRGLADKWLAAGREVLIIEPELKGDANDALNARRIA
jgi:putative DNA primase/helicase